MSVAARKVGLLGGTFDPIHLGHVSLALACARELGLDEVRLMPARLPPHKPAPAAGAFDRHGMVALASSADARLVPDPRELLRSGPSWTIDTLEEIRSEDPALDLHLLVGADSLRDLATWRRWNDIATLAVIVATGRAGIDLDEASRGAAGRLPEGRVRIVRHEPPGWSSTEIRRCLASGDECTDALDPLVAAFIRKRRLYTSAAVSGREPQEILP